MADPLNVGELLTGIPEVEAMPVDPPNAVDVPGSIPETPGVMAEIWGATTGAVSAVVSAPVALVKYVAKGAATTVSQTGEWLGGAVGGTAAKLIWPLVPIVLLLVIGLGVALRISGQKLRMGVG